MNYINKINSAIAYIDINLKNKIDKETIAKISCMTYDIFSRLFNILTGYTITNYIGNRKLGEAAKEILISDKKIIDIAFEYGYGSSEAFNHAFKKYHNASPTAVKNGAKYKYMFPLEIEASVKGGSRLTVSLVKTAAFTLSGCEVINANEIKTSDLDIEIFWKTFRERIGKKIDIETTDFYEVILHNGKKPIYYAACERFDEELNKKLNLEIIEIPKGEYALFTIRGSIDSPSDSVIQNIMQTFFNVGDGNLYLTPEFAKYPAGDRYSDHYEMMLYIAVN